MRKMVRVCVVAAGVSSSMWLVGCGSGASLASFFSGAGDAAEEFFSFFGGGDDGGETGNTMGAIADVVDSSGSGSSSGDLGQQVASVHHPEPATVALFGGGLVGLALTRQRRSKRKS